MTTKEKVHFYDVKTKISKDDVLNLIVSAIEGGITYWCLSYHGKLAHGLRQTDFKDGGKFAEKEYFPSSYLLPFVPGCKLLFEAEDHANPDHRKGLWELDLEKMKRGFDLMAEKSPEHFADIITENTDATTADVWMQYALFGEVVFG